MVDKPMNIAIQEAVTLIKHYEVLEFEMAKEGPDQLASIAIVQKRYNRTTIQMLQQLIELERMVPSLIEKIRRLEELDHGKSAS